VVPETPAAPAASGEDDEATRRSSAHRRLDRTHRLRDGPALPGLGLWKAARHGPGQWRAYVEEHRPRHPPTQRLPTSRERRRRNGQWKTFCTTHWTQLAACDFVSVTVVTLAGMRRVFVLVVIHLATRRIHIAVVTQHPDQAVMTNVARQLSMADGILEQWNARFLIHDGDGAFSKTGFDAVLTSGGITIRRTAPRSSNMNAHAERVIRSIQEECTDHFWFFGERSLRGALAEYCNWYHHHRPHQGIGNRIIEPGAEIGRTEGLMVMRSRFAGRLVHWERRAA